MSQPQDPKTASTPLARRRLFAGAGTVGALAAAAAVLPGVQSAAPVAAAAPAEPPEAGGGYRLSEHVQRYYQTARV
ncbi:formate dehydrogenase [Ideonella livida]|uniref:Formate dehydrogenase n=1 Tax=Ideonella livida TaxID=2707176 RepID=A0A7C9TJL5_9BURK|nr:formate dehydrogenase [Ideonella livida]NDY91838.1 formate dehydrogenase [Ideonella livida]